MMNIVLATGIYPPDIGGPATYVRNLAETLCTLGMNVSVVTYAGKKTAYPPAPWSIHAVSPRGFIVRWFRYARILRRVARDADVVYAFSSVSVGVPLRLARLSRPKKVLRLGGDFLWERYTDWRGSGTLREWYARRPFLRLLMQWLLGGFQHLVFSTQFQERLYERSFSRLPPHSVIQNALPHGSLWKHTRHEPFRLLFFGRFVRFKNLPHLLKAVENLPHVTLTLVGEGPMSKELSLLARVLHLKGRLVFLPSVSGEEKEKTYLEHDLLVIPSITELSPNAALEARSHGLPVLLTEETGLSEDLRAGMIITKLRSSQDITRAILEAEHSYDAVAEQACAPLIERGWDAIAQEHVALFRSFL